jgi:hypothetical protein
LARTGQSIDPLEIKNAVDAAGVLLGLGAGAAWLGRLGGFRTSGSPQQRVKRYVLGLLGLLIVWFGIRAILPQGASVLSYSLRYLRSALAGFWVSAAAPFIFKRLGLAEPM